MAIVPLRIRFDDVITSSSSPKHHGREVETFIKNVNWCLRTNVTLTPAILCQDIQQFPEGIEWLHKMVEEGIIYPDLHGWDHGPYATRSQQEIEEHLDKSFVWFKKNLGVIPFRWVTPHGARSPSIYTAATKYKLVVEGTDYPVIDQKNLNNYLRTTKNLNILENRIIMNHWWEQGLRLFRIARIIEHQSIIAAIQATKGELNPRDHLKCWEGWD